MYNKFGVFLKKVILVDKVFIFFLKSDNVVCKICEEKFCVLWKFVVVSELVSDKSNIEEESKLNVSKLKYIFDEIIVNEIIKV